MRKISLIVIASIALSATAAYSADLPPAYTKAPAMAPVAGWTGFYIGLNGGYGWKDPSVSYSTNDPVTFVTLGAGAGAISPPANWKNSGGLGGGQMGYNWQIDRQWLFGLEADIDASDIKGSATSNTSAGGVPSIIGSNQKVDWFGSVRARVGWLPTDRLLIFGTGGFAFGNVKENVNLVSSASLGVPSLGGFQYVCVAGTPCFIGSSSSNRTGWAAGGGVEYALWKNLTVKAEYLYVDLGSGNNVRVTAANGGGFIPGSFTAAFSGVSFNVVRAGLNVRF